MDKLEGNLKSNKEFAKELEQRTKKFAIQIIKLASQLPKSPVSKVITYQLIKAGTSIGANYREANRSVSKADFKSKISICTEDAKENICFFVLSVSFVGCLSWEFKVASA